MIKLTPIVMAIAVAVGMYMMSAWRLNRQLDRQSTEPADPRLLEVTNKLARVLDLPRIKVNIFEVDPVDGLAAPDGRIFITRGFYDKYRLGDVSAEEVTSVIAHDRPR